MGFTVTYTLREKFYQVKLCLLYTSYTRIIKTGNRLGDNAAMCFIELVDYNENMLKDTAAKKACLLYTSRCV